MIPEVTAPGHMYMPEEAHPSLVISIKVVFELISSETLYVLFQLATRGLVVQVPVLLCPQPVKLEQISVSRISFFM
jgi:hypothetical protein